MLDGLRGFKGTPYEGGLRVPLLVSWPEGGVLQGARRSQLVSQVDLVRTLVTLAGGSVPEGQAMDSLDFSAALFRSPGDCPHPNPSPSPSPHLNPNSNPNAHPNPPTLTLTL